jgi:NADH-quinone oxidoreductase subunit N
MSELVVPMLPELVLLAVACVLFLLGVSNRPSVRRLTATLALLALVALFVYQLLQIVNLPGGDTLADPWNTVSVGAFARYVKLLTLGVGAILVLLAWPTNAQATGSPSMDVGTDTGEFFGLMLLSIAGVLLVAGANDIMLLFLAIELASIPTYIMVSISRPLPVAQEAGVKYFFLGAMAAAVMLFGFSYLYGVTGQTKLDQIAVYFQSLPVDATGRPAWTTWPMLAVVMLLAGFAFKIAAVPLHAYAGDVYEGAATPVTAFLAFTPKTSGFVALIKILGVVCASGWAVPEEVTKLLWVIAVLTMSFGNVLALAQKSNVKRVLAYSSVAHSGYMLVGLTALISAPGNEVVQRGALQGILFYLAAYGLSNAATFGILMMLPSRTADPHGAPRPHRLPHGKHVHAPAAPATTAETFEDLAGQGRHHVVLGLGMAIACFSLTGIPLTIGFLGKFYVVAPALRIGSPLMNWLVAITMLNAAISAGYYLKIVSEMFLKGDPTDGSLDESDLVKAHRLSRLIERGAGPGLIAIGVSVGLTLVFGLVVPPTVRLTDRASEAAADEVRAAGGAPAPQAVSAVSDSPTPGAP